MKKLITLFALVLILTSTTPVLAVTATNSTGAKTTTVCIDLTGNLSIADKGTKVSEVLKLQSFLYPQYLTEPPTGYFGVLTDAAVKKLQAEYSDEIATPTGYVGPLTRNIIKELTCGGNSQTSAGTKTGETVARTPASTGSSYNPNGAWWLDPAATGAGSTGSNSTVKTNSTNSNTTPTSTTTPPIDCDKYAGVIPGESRKLTVEERSVRSSVYKPSSQYGAISPEGLRDLQLMYGDIGHIISIGQGTPSTWYRERLTPGTVYAYKFKTTEYNYAPYYDISSHYNPETRVGIIGMSVSECPGDFTSPEVLEQAGTVGSDREGKFPDRKFRSCVNYNDPINARFIFGVPVAPTLETGCELEPNKTYYINITTGFFNEEEGSKYPYITDEGHDEGAGPNTDMVIDIEMRAFGAQAAATQVYGNVPNVSVEMIKNRSAAYSEMARFQRMFEDFRRAGEVRRQACVATLPFSDRPEASDIGGQYSAGWRRCTQLGFPPLPPFDMR